MAVRTPLINNAGDIQQMTSAQIDQVIDHIIYLYSTDPGVSMSVVSSGGSLSAISDTRLQAGAQSTSVSSFPSEATTAEPSVVTVSYDKMSSSTASVTPTTDTGTTWPVYYTSGGHLQAMSLQDVKDTFLHPAIDLLVSGSTTTQQAGTYTIATTSSLAGATEVSGSATPIFL